MSLLCPKTRPAYCATSWIFIGLLFLLLLGACKSDKVADTYLEKSNGIFTRADSISIAFNITDTTKLYDFTVEVQHNSDFGFQNLYTNIQTEYPNGQRVRQLLSLELSEASGKPYGNCSGNACTVQIPTKVFFNALGQYRITLSPFARPDTLKGILRLAMRLQNTKDSKNNFGSTSTTKQDSTSTHHLKK